MKRFTDQEFLNLTLSIFNIEREITDGSLETRLVAQFKPLAYRECCMFADWSFLIKTETYEESDSVDDEYDGHKYGFTLPEDFLKARLINDNYNEAFSVKGNCIYVDYPTLKLDYYSYDYTNAPVEFDQLACYRCAIDISQLLDPNGAALSTAQSLHQIVLTTLSNRDVNMTRKKTAEFDLDDTVFKVPTREDKWLIN